MPAIFGGKNYISRLLINGKGRYVIPLVTITIFRIAVGWIIFKEFVSEHQVTIFPWHSSFLMMNYLDPIPPSNSWLYLFSGWDTEFYIVIARSGYFQPLYAFFPVYPAIIRGLAFFVSDYWLSATLISIFFGTIYLPVFQRLAEHYMTKSESLCSTLIFGFFPFVFLYTTVAYTESLFLFFILVSWLLYKQGNLLYASLACSCVSITKIYGIVVVIPIFLDLIVNRKIKKIFYLSIPIIFLFAWLSYCFLTTGEWLAFRTGAVYFGKTFELHTGWIQKELLTILQSSSTEMLLRAGFILVFSILVISSWNIDWRLGSYSLVMFILLLYFGTIQSLPRFLPFIYPVWLVPRIRSAIPFIAVIVLFSLIDVKIWYMFIMAKPFIA